MKTWILFAVASLGFLSVAHSQSGTLFTNPVIYVTPIILDFGPVEPNTSATNSFVVENMGRGVLKGKAAVDAPFKILSGEEYSLGPSEAQVVTVVYTPKETGRHTNTVKFSGGSGTTAKVMGRGGIGAKSRSKRR